MANVREYASISAGNDSDLRVFEGRCDGAAASQLRRYPRACLRADHCMLRRRARAVVGGSSEHQAAEHRPRPHRRPALGHPLGHVDRRARARGSRGHVHEQLCRQSTLLPEPLEPPHRSLLALDRRLPEQAAARRVPVVPRLVHDRDRPPRRRLHDRLLRQVPERVRRCLARRALRPAGLGHLDRLPTRNVLLQLPPGRTGARDAPRPRPG